MAAGREGRPAPDDIEPPEDYVMSPEFQAWLVQAMRSEVMDQVQGAGLDRMAIIKPAPGEGSEEEGQDEERPSGSDAPE